MIINLSPIMIAVERVIIRHELDILSAQLDQETKYWPKATALAYYFSRMADYVGTLRARIEAIGNDPLNVIGRTLH